MQFVEDYNSFIGKLEESGEFSGTVLLARGKEELFTKAYGYANRDWNIKNKIDTRFDTASVTKVFTTVVILKLIEEGKLSFDTGIIDFLELNDAKIPRDVKVYHLLTYSSGIADDCDEELGEDYEEYWKDKPNYSMKETRDFLPNFIYKDAKYKAGEKCNYNNAAFVLLGLAIEKITGMQYREYMAKHFFPAMGMTDTEFLRMDVVRENAAEGYSAVYDENEKITGWRKNYYSFPPVGSPESGVYTTVRDIHRFFIALKEHKYLSREMTEGLFSPKEYYRDVHGMVEKYGYGFYFRLTGDGKIVSMEKDGVNTGVNAIISYFPDQDLVSAILTNGDFNAYDPHFFLLKSIIEGKFK